MVTTGYAREIYFIMNKYIHGDISLVMLNQKTNPITEIPPVTGIMQQYSKNPT
jgi:hypothetical protein